MVNALLGGALIRLKKRASPLLDMDTKVVGPKS